MTPFWVRHEGADLAQGDLLPSCLIPTFDPQFGEADEEEIVPCKQCNLIVVTQSCDLANAKATFVAGCPVFSLEQFEAKSARFKEKGAWEQVRKGRREGLHMLAGPDEPTNNRQAVIVDFREIHSLPFNYLSNHAERLRSRWRLQSPFLEHFSQAFARFFMRVGLPAAIPPFK
jgi:hypothetical protein